MGAETALSESGVEVTVLEACVETAALLEALVELALSFPLDKTGIISAKHTGIAAKVITGANIAETKTTVRFLNILGWAGFNWLHRLPE